MRKFSTMLSCLCLAIFGAVVGLNNKSPAVTANAAPTFSYLPRDLQLPKIKYDTIYMTKDSIIPCKKNHYPKRKEVRIPYAVRDTLYVPVVTTIILRDRTESSQDSTMCTIIRNDSTQVQKPIETPDSVFVVKPVEYSRYESHLLAENPFIVQSTLTWWENMLACSTGEKLKRYHERHTV